MEYCNLELLIYFRTFLFFYNLLVILQSFTKIQLTTLIIDHCKYYKLQRYCYFVC